MLEGAPSERNQREDDPGTAGYLRRQLTARFSSIAAAALVVGAAGCDAGSPARQPVDAPPAHLVKVVATGVDATGAPVAATLARDGSTKNVASIAALHLTFDRFLLPPSALRQAFCLQGVGKVTSNQDCVNGRVFLAPSYDPTRRELVLVQVGNDGMPLKQLAPGTAYQLTLYKAPDDPCLPPNDLRNECFGIRAFDGAPLEETSAAPLSYEFTTSATEPTGLNVETMPTEDFYCETPCLTACATAFTSCKTACGTGTAPDCSLPQNATNCFCMCQAADTSCTKQCGEPVSLTLNRCATSACHAAGTVTKEKIPVGPAMGLDLSDETSITQTAINRVAHETQTGEHASDPDTTPLRFGRAMPIIASGNPGNSYLVYKLLVNHYIASDAETRRLRNDIIVGMPMPPSNWPPLELDNLVRISAWIGQGSPMPAAGCPPTP